MTDVECVPLPDLRQIRLDELPQHAGDPLLEAMLERLERQVHSADTVAGFSSAI